MNTSKTELTAVTEHTATWPCSGKREGRTAVSSTSGLSTRFVGCRWRKQNGPSHKLPADNTGQFLHSKCMARQFHLTMLHRLRRLHTLTAISNSQTAGLSQRQSAFACRSSRTEANGEKVIRSSESNPDPSSTTTNYYGTTVCTCPTQNLDTFYLRLCTSVLIATVCPLYTVPERTQSAPTWPRCYSCRVRDTIDSTAGQIHSSPACINRSILTNSSELHLLMTQLYVVLCCVVDNTTRHNTTHNTADVPPSEYVYTLFDDDTIQFTERTGHIRALCVCPDN